MTPTMGHGSSQGHQQWSPIPLKDTKNEALFTLADAGTFSTPDNHGPAPLKSEGQ